MLFKDILTNWSLAFGRKRPDLGIPGSPERCLFRHVAEDACGGLWLLEQLAPGQAARREAIGQLLEGLSGRGLDGLAPYRRTTSGSFVCKDWGRSWQLSPFIVGVPLVQPDYLEDAGKGAALGGWMAAFRRASDGLPVPDGLFSLDLPAYVAELLARIRRSAGAGHCRQDTGDADSAGAAGKNEQSSDRQEFVIDLSAVHARASGVLHTLACLFEAWPHLPRALCHGDVHPVNVIWGGTTWPSKREGRGGTAEQAEPAESPLRAVIDWEFAGVRPALYDLANCLGCLFIEGGSLDTPFARALLDAVRSAGFLPPDQASRLPSMILASRFGWLSEWLRRRDAEMIALELSFMEHLASLPDARLLIPS